MWLTKLEDMVVIVKQKVPAQNVRTQVRCGTNENTTPQHIAVEIKIYQADLY